MTSTARLDWNGDALIDKLAAAARRALNATVDDAAAEASASHPWVTRTGQLEEEIVSEHVDPNAPGNPTAKFGTTRRRGFYGLFHEEGTVHEYAHPFIRPAGDVVFPTLPARIREELDGR